MKRYMNWGTSIAAVYTTFALCTVAFVVFALDHPVDLVSADYYAQSLQVDARQAARARTDGLTGFAIAVSPDGREVTVVWPAEQHGRVRGTAALYRPASARDDRVVTLAPDAVGRQVLSLADLPGGRWSLQVSWEAGDQAYYAARDVTVR